MDHLSVSRLHTREIGMGQETCPSSYPDFCYLIKGVEPLILGHLTYTEVLHQLSIRINVEPLNLEGSTIFDLCPSYLSRKQRRTSESGGFDHILLTMRSCYPRGFDP